MEKKITDNEKEELEIMKSRWHKQLDRQNSYAKDNYDKIGIVVKKGRKPEILEHAKKMGFKNMTQYITHLIDEDMSKNADNDEVPF